MGMYDWSGSNDGLVLARTMIDVCGALFSSYSSPIATTVCSTQVTEGYLKRWVIGYVRTTVRGKCYVLRNEMV
jgi:hypothetical protein